MPGPEEKQRGVQYAAAAPVMKRHKNSIAHTPPRNTFRVEVNARARAEYSTTMRRVKETPVFRVRRQTPYTSARERWKHRMVEERIAHARQERRRNTVERVPLDERRGEVIPNHREERGPAVNESAPYYSSCDGAEGNTARIRQAPLAKNTVTSSNEYPAPPVCQSGDSWGSGSPEKITLLSLLAAPDNRPPTLSIEDVPSIDQRFQTMSVSQQAQRRRVQKAAQKEKIVATRRRILMNTMGMQKYYKALSLVKKIKHLRQKILRSCSCGSIDEEIATLPKKTLSSYESLPSASRDLLVNTDLVSALEQTETERLGKLPWEEFILQAHKNVDAYYEWQSISETRE